MWRLIWNVRWPHGANASRSMCTVRRMTALHLNFRIGKIVEQILFTLIDADGNRFAVPAQVIETKMAKHRFVVHKSLSLSNDEWTVSHKASGGAAAIGKTKAEAIAAATKRINGMTVKAFEESLTRLLEVRKNLENEQRDARIAALR